MGEGLGSEIYSGAASFGQVWALIGAIFATIICLVCLFAGGWMIIRKPWEKTSGIITSINGSTTGTCDSTTEPNQSPLYSCNVSLSYSFNGVNYTSNIYYSGSTKHYVGEQVVVYVKSDSDPTNVSLDQDPPKSVGVIVIVMGLLAAALGWFWYWASRKYKFVAAAEGVAGAASLIRGAI